MKRIAHWIIAAAVAVSVVSFWQSVAVAQSPQAPMWGEITGDRVNIRAGHSTADRIVITANRGSVFLIVGQKESWVQLQAGPDVECWIFASLVNRQGDVGVVTASTRVNLRATSSTQYPPIGQAEAGATVRILQTSGEWLRIVPPAGVSMWVNSSYIRPARAATAQEVAAYLGTQGLSGNSANVAAEPVANGQFAAGTSASASSSAAASSEQQVYAELVARFNQALSESAQAGMTADVLQRMDVLAADFENFAAACQTPTVVAAARERAATLRKTKSVVEALMQEQNRSQHDVESATRHALEKAQQDARMIAEAEIRAARERAEEIRREQILQRLLYNPADGYVARGQVADARDENGRKVYILVDNGQVLYRLELAPSAAHVDLRELWHRSVGIQGRIVKIDGEQYPVLVCTRIDAQR